MGTRRTRPQPAPAQYLIAVLCLVTSIGGVPATTAQDAAAEIDIIALRHRIVAEVLPVVAPLLTPPGSVSGMHNQLVVKATPAELAEVRRVVAELDRPLRRLRITVRQDVVANVLHREDAVSGAISSGDLAATLPDAGAADGASVSVGDARRRVRYRVLSTRDDRDSQQVQFVETVEGQPAYLHAGRDVPLANRSLWFGPLGVNLVDTIEYRSTGSGFYVLPRLSGETVLLEIAPHRSSLSPYAGGAVDVQQLTATVSGRLGVWFLIGGIAEDFDQSADAHLTRTRRRDHTLQHIWVKVDELP